MERIMGMKREEKNTHPGRRQKRPHARQQVEKKREREWKTTRRRSEKAGKMSRESKDDVFKVTSSRRVGLNLPRGKWSLIQKSEVMTYDAKDTLQRQL